MRELCRSPLSLVLCVSFVALTAVGCAGNPNVGLWSGVLERLERGSDFRSELEDDTPALARTPGSIELRLRIREFEPKGESSPYPSFDHGPGPPRCTHGIDLGDDFNVVVPDDDTTSCTDSGAGGFGDEVDLDGIALIADFDLYLNIDCSAADCLPPGERPAMRVHLRDHETEAQVTYAGPVARE